MLLQDGRKRGPRRRGMALRIKKTRPFGYKSGNTKRDPAGPTYDQLELLIGWKNTIKVKPREENPQFIFDAHQITGFDLSKIAKEVQGTFINIKWKVEPREDGVTINEFKNLDLNRRFMYNGLIFLWSDKRILNEILEVMEQKGFAYVENFVIILLRKSVAIYELQKLKPSCQTCIQIIVLGFEGEQMSYAKKQELLMSNLDVLQDRIGVKELIYKQPYKYLNSSKKILLMFRKIESTRTQLELRHQRTADVVFDIIDDKNFKFGIPEYIDKTTKEYVYQMIETLLPKAGVDSPAPKLVELQEIVLVLIILRWGDPQYPRKGWITVLGKK